MSSEMLDAVAEGDIDVVRSYLESSHISITSRVLDDQLEVAYNNRDGLMMELLLRYGADPTVILLPAVCQKQYMIIQQLIRFGANVNLHIEGTFNSHYYQTAVVRRTIPLVCHAILSNDESMSLLLLRNGANMHAADSEGDTVLSYSLHKKMRYLATLLISKGCDINARNNDGYTILHMAGMSSLRSIVTTLLDMKADGSNHPKSKTLLHMAADYDDNYRISVEDEFGDGEMYIFHELLQRGLDVNAQDNLGNTALHIIVEKLPLVANLDTTYIIKELVNAKADISIENKAGHTPVSLMAKMSRQYHSHTDTKMVVLNLDPILRQVVWLELIGKPIRDKDSNIIENNIILKTNINPYKLQVTEMRKRKYNGVSIADFFTVDLRRIVWIAMNPRFVKAYKRADKKKRFPVFMDKVEQIWSRAEKKRDWFKTLKPIFHRHLPVEVIFEIALYLDC